MMIYYYFGSNIKVEIFSGEKFSGILRNSP